MSNTNMVAGYTQVAVSTVYIRIHVLTYTHMYMVAMTANYKRFFLILNL